MTSSYLSEESLMWLSISTSYFYCRAVSYSCNWALRRTRAAIYLPEEASFLDRPPSAVGSFFLLAK